MYLTGLTHRERLFELTLRWLLDRPEPSDGRFVTEVFLFENLISAPTVRSFVRSILDATGPGPIDVQLVRSKDEVRRCLMSACRNPSHRAARLFEKFRTHPEEFFPRTPVDLTIATRPDRTLLGMTRFKRIRRIADKVSRRLADRLAGEIRAKARVLAAARARTAGVPLDRLVSSPEVMTDEFATAEREVAQSFKDGSLRLEPPGLRVDDVIGSKLVGAEDELERVEAAIQEHPTAKVVRREVHQGDYNDVNLLVDLDLPPVEAIVESARERDWSYATQRGLDTHSLPEDFANYTRRGARTIRTEVILTTFGDLVESEFGRSIHEERILSQRLTASYHGRIAQNASYIIEYLLNLAVSPTVEVAQLPVKMWGRYLPDTLAVAISKLYGGYQADRLFDTFGPEPSALSVPRAVTE